jgi:hypothetical protein
MSKLPRRFIWVADSAIAGVVAARHATARADAAIRPVLVCRMGHAIVARLQVVGGASLALLAYDWPGLSTAGWIDNRGRTCG